MPATRAFNHWFWLFWYWDLVIGTASIEYWSDSLSKLNGMVLSQSTLIGNLSGQPQKGMKKCGKAYYSKRKHCHFKKILEKRVGPWKKIYGNKFNKVVPHSLMNPANSLLCSSSRNIKEFQRDLRFRHSQTVLFTIPPKSVLY